MKAFHANTRQPFSIFGVSASLPEFVGRWQVAHGGDRWSPVLRLANSALGRLRSAAAALVAPPAVDPDSRGLERPGPTEYAVLPMGSGVNILPDASAQITSRPQHVAFRPKRIVIGGDPGHWIVNEIKIGRRSQFADQGDVPGVAFSADARDANVHLDVVRPGVNFTMVVTYVGPDPGGAPFQCSVLGPSGTEAEDPDPAETTSRIYLPLSSGVKILPNTSFEICAHPQEPFRAERIIIGGDPNRWVVNDIKVGARSQLSQSGDIPGVTFSASSSGGLGLETAQAGMKLVLWGTYVGKEPEGEALVACAIGSVPS